MTEINKVYYAHKKALTPEEAQSFVTSYRAGIVEPKNKSRYMTLLPYVPQGSYVLDYGCGWGIFSELLVEQRQCRVDGIDIDAHSVEIAADFIRQREGLSFAEKRIQEISDNVYDVVISTQVAEHTHNPGNYIKECNRVLKRGGYLIISVPNILNPRFIVPMMWRNHQKTYGRISAEINRKYEKTRHHIQAWDSLTFCRLLCSLGFEYEDHAFMDGVALPKTKYWHTRLPGVKNLSYTMMFKVKKLKYVDIANDD